MSFKQFCRKAIDKAPELGATVGGLAGLGAGLALDLYNPDAPRTSYTELLRDPLNELRALKQAPYGMITTATTLLGAGVGTGIGAAIKDVPETYRLLVKRLPKTFAKYRAFIKENKAAHRTGLKVAAINSAIMGGLFYYSTKDPLLASLMAAANAPFGYVLGIMLDAWKNREKM